MILHIYAYKDKKIGAFTQPVYLPHDSDVALVQFVRSLKTTSDEEKAKLKSFDLYYLGRFDDESGVIEGDLKLLISDVGDIHG